MKFIKIILKILLPLMLIILTLSFILEKTVVTTFSSEVFSKKVSGYILDEFVQDYDSDKLGWLETSIRNSEYTEKITSKFIDTILENIANNETNKIDIEKEVDLLIAENIPEDVAKEKTNKAKEYLLKQVNIVEKEINNVVDNNFSQYLGVIKAYNIFINFYLRVALIILTILDIITLIIIDKKWLKSVKTSVFITAIITSCLLGLIIIFKNYIDQYITGGLLGNINLNYMITSVIVEAIIFIILLIIDRKK